MTSSKALCRVCEKGARSSDTTPARALRPALRAYLDTGRPAPLDDADEVCRTCLLKARSKQMTERLSAERGNLSAIELEVAEKAAAHATIASDLEAKFLGSATAGQRLADAVARVGGSWAFVSGFMVALVLWMILNTFVLGGRGFDPYPYILLNLVLSCLAALQAPIIMMSQNRTSARDRMQADHDFRVNLKAELEIAGLHEKLDHLLHEQWESLLELQQEQLDALAEMRDARLSTAGSSMAPAPPSEPRSR
jgi:uncharacterized membrane protein